MDGPTWTRELLCLQTEQLGLSGLQTARSPRLLLAGTAHGDLATMFSILVSHGASDLGCPAGDRLKNDLHGTKSLHSQAIFRVLHGFDLGQKALRLGSVLECPRNAFRQPRYDGPSSRHLGLGRAPGTDALTAHALRRTLSGDVDAFPDDVQELLGYFDADQSGRRVRAFPGAGAAVEVWILGSSLFGAQLASTLGLPYAFASHFAPGLLMEAIDLYRRTFRPSAHLKRPHLMLGVNVVAAERDDEARYLLTSLQQAFVNLRSGCRRTKASLDM